MNWEQLHGSERCSSVLNMDALGRQVPVQCSRILGHDGVHWNAGWRWGVTW